MPLSPLQDQVLNLIASGLSATAAARQTGVHRHTVANWLKLEEFCEGLETARHHKQILFWDQALALVSEAIADLRQLKQPCGLPLGPPACHRPHAQTRPDAPAR